MPDDIDVTTQTDAQGQTTGTEPTPNGAAEPPARKSGGLSKIGEALDQYLKSDASKSGSLEPEGDEDDPENEEEPTPGAGENGEEPPAGDASGGEGQAEVTPVMLAAAKRLGISEKALRAMPPDVRDEVLAAERQATAKISGLSGRLKQIESERRQSAGTQTTQGADEGEDPETDGGDGGEEPTTPTKTSPRSTGRPTLPANLPGKLDVKAIKEKFILAFGDEQAEALMEAVVDPFAGMIDQMHQQREREQQENLSSMAIDAEAFMNKSGLTDLFGASYNAASAKQREARKEFATKAMRMLQAGLESDWPTALEQTLRRREYSSQSKNRAEDAVRGTIVKRAGSVTPSPSRHAGGRTPATAPKRGLDAIASALRGVLGSDQDD